MSLPLDGPTLAVDSDVLFLAGARGLPKMVAAATAPRYQLDCYNVLDGRIVAEEEQGDPTNTGVLLLPGPLDWSRGLAVLEEHLADSDFFRWDGPWVEQGVTHLALRDSGAAPLDPARFVISGDDVGRWREAAMPASAVLRHYAGPTRHFFWTRVARESGGRGRGRAAQRPSASP